MSHNFLLNASFHQFLIWFDQVSANQTQAHGCTYCGGKLDRANYPRKVIGVPGEYRHHYQQRLSFCCRLCRRRTTAPSVRFLGRFRYAFALVALVSALQSISGSRMQRVYARYGIRVPPQTRQRWRYWWKKSFIQSPFWRTYRGFFAHPIAVGEGTTFRWLLRQFSGTLLEKLLRAVVFLSPLTVPNLHTI